MNPDGYPHSPFLLPLRTESENSLGYSSAPPGSGRKNDRTNPTA
jgi:hypothetical protein